MKGFLLALLIATAFVVGFLFCMTRAANAATVTHTYWIVGVTTGMVECNQDPKMAVAVCKFHRYENSTSTAQTWVYPVPFDRPPCFPINSIPPAKTSPTQLSLPTDMPEPFTGHIIVTTCDDD